MMAKGLSIEQARYADYVASGLTLTEAYRRAFPKSKAQGASLNVQASRLRNLPEINERIQDLMIPVEQRTVARDKRLLDPEWMIMEVANGLYEIATSDESAKMRIEAWKSLGSLRPINCFVTQSGTSVNIQNNQLTGGQTPNDADSMRSLLVSELRQLAAPAPAQPLDVVVRDYVNCE